MIGVMIIPTGIGCEIGGHAGDANPVAKLIASVCDKLILHPNVVNASDINEMPENSLYVEGSTLDNFLEGNKFLYPVKSNKILVAVNKPCSYNITNSVSAARATLGADISIVELNTPLEMIAKFGSIGEATGEVKGWRELVDQMGSYDFDALAISSKIDIDEEVALRYCREGGINPWGGVEAKASRLISDALNKPVAHAPAPAQEDDPLFSFAEVVDPRIASEMVSISYIHCVLKGLHKAPRTNISPSLRFLSYSDVDFLITPWGCVGRPHRACMKKKIPIIVVRENQSCLNDTIPSSFIQVSNYQEAIGVIQSMKIGITTESVRRPIKFTKVIKEII